jgi:hypothetical protein
VLFLLVVSGFLPAWYSCTNGLTDLHHRQLGQVTSIQGGPAAIVYRSALQQEGQSSRRPGRCGVSLRTILFEKMTIDEREIAVGRPALQTQHTSLHAPDAQIAGLVSMPGIPFITTAPKYVLHSSFLV